MTVIDTKDGMTTVLLAIVIDTNPVTITIVIAVATMIVTIEDAIEAPLDLLKDGTILNLALHLLLPLSLRNPRKVYRSIKTRVKTLDLMIKTKNELMTREVNHVETGQKKEVCHIQTRLQVTARADLNHLSQEDQNHLRSKFRNDLD